MTGSRDEKTAAETRARAEQQLLTVPATIDDADLRVVLHELQVHRIELEMQNEELRAAQAEIQRQLERYSKLYDYTPVGYLSMQRDGSISTANLSGAAMLGTPRSLLLQHPFQDWLADESQGVFRTFLEQVFGERGRQSCQLLLKTSGQKRHLHLEAFSVDADTACDVVMVDVSERQQAEETRAQLAAIVESTPDAIFSENADGIITTWNRGAEKVFGYAAPEVIGRPGNILDTPGCRKQQAEIWAQLGAGEALEQYEIDQRRRDGTIIPVSITIAPIRDVTGAVTGISRIARDVSERNKIRNDFKIARDQAERANNAKSRFLAAASHDLRQPLAALSIYVGALKGMTTPTGVPLLNNMANCVDSLSDLLCDLLDLSKLEAGVLIPDTRNFPLSELLQSLVAVHNPEAALKGLHLRLRQPTDNLHVATDPVLFKRLLGNLLANAIRYTWRGGILIACRRSQGKMWLEVWDTGIGIPADKTGVIFEEFRQLDNDDKHRGSGLGLAIVAKTAALLDLQIRVRSRVGKGSMFAVEIPLGSVSPEVRSYLPVFRPLHVALTEDNAEVREALILGLTAIGHRVTAAATGIELFEQLGQNAPDIVISDFRLGGGITGFDVIEDARALFGEELPALLITGDTNPEIMRSMADRGIIVQHKPVKIDTLQACMAQVTNRRQHPR